MRRRFELMQFEIGMSTSRYLLASGTAGLARSRVSGNRRVPCPPPMMMERTLLVLADMRVPFDIGIPFLRIAVPALYPGAALGRKQQADRAVLMCGIVGYVGRQPSAPILLEGLRRLEYRGYDSAGVSVLNGAQLQTRKKMGKLDEGLGQLLKARPAPGRLGIGHTRWATHGPPSDENSHPHLDQSDRIAVVHNGVIENFDRIKERLIQAGHHFRSETDTEVLAHLIGERYANLQSSAAGANRDGVSLLTRAVTESLKEVIGTYGIAVVCADCPDLIVGARRGSPLLVGLGAGENFLASDASAIVAHTRQVVYLNDYDVATLTPARFDVENLGTGTASFQISQVEFSAEAAERGKFPHYMLKEIFEQPRALENAVRGRMDHEEATAKFGGLNMTTAELRAVDQIVIAA